MSYYQQIEGVQLDRAVVDACAAAVQGKGDGRVSIEDAHEVFKFIKDANKVTDHELWALRYCLTEFNFTEAAGDWITSAVKAISKRDPVKGGSSKGYYEKVDGVKCDRELLEVCRKAVAGAGDGRVSKDDAKEVLKAVLDGGKVTDTEKWTVRLCLSEFNWTEAAHDFLIQELKAFGAPLKRPASSSIGGKPKKVKDDTPAKVKSVLTGLKVAEKKQAVPSEVSNLVKTLAENSLSTKLEDRHPFQEEAFTMIEKVLEAGKESLTKELADATTLLDNADAEKVTREAAVKDCEDKLAAAQEAKKAAATESQDKTAEYKATVEPLKAALAEQKEGDAAAVSLEKDKAALEEAVKDLPALKEQGPVKARPIAALEKALTKAGLESSLVSSIHLPLKQKPEDRGDFSRTILDKLDEAIAKTLADYTTKIAGEGPAREERAAKVQAAKDIHDAAKAASDAAANASKEAKDAAANLGEELEKAKKAQTSLESELRAAAKTKEDATKALENFTAGPLADFQSLKERTEHVEDPSGAQDEEPPSLPSSPAKAPQKAAASSPAGTPQKAAASSPAKPPQQNTSCPTCGNVYAEDASFCRMCGRKRDE